MSFALTTIAPDSLTEKLALTVIGAILGILGAYVVDRLKARREPLRRLSYEVEVARALIEVQPDIRSRVKILYSGREVGDLAHVRCRITNTGNRVVKNHHLRFTFPERATLLEAYLAPEPEPELGVTLVGESHHPQAERRYRIDHLEHGESVTYNFVTAGGDFRGWRPRSHNDEGDVAFQRRGVEAAKEDAEHITRFLLILIVYFLATAVAGSVSFGYLTDLLQLTVHVAAIVALAPHLLPTVRVVQRLLARQATGVPGTVTNVVAGDDGSVVVLHGSTVTDLRIKTDNDDEPRNVHLIIPAQQGPFGPPPEGPERRRSS
ncbi:hypothetical protein [Micromonospora auratinigra]|uniref:Uncharacterized protein n=1 Tax=Micromonospora auratinigra TaxID=261654 RepID=A0A1A9A8H0_9ACTN|nr:hypothetical protein [Micromonospora auratinigra]SBT52460.1 hypothetical protein GA0070611_5647 [Micromonospora auratinigra]